MLLNVGRLVYYWPRD